MTDIAMDKKALAPCPFCNASLNYIEPNGGEPSAQHLAAWNRRASPSQRPAVDVAEHIATVRKWLDGGCSSWGVPSTEISAILAALASIAPQGGDGEAT